MANRSGMEIDVRRYAIVATLSLLSAMLLLTACGSKRQVAGVRRAPPAPKDEKSTYAKVEKRETQGVQYGIASWYGPDFHGKQTSSGEIYDMYQLTCAHNTLPLGTMVIVTNLENGRSLEVKVNDRGPFTKDRIIDLSYAAASILGVYEKGTAWVKVETIGPWIDEVQRLTLQVASFTDENNAQRLAEQLRRDFNGVYVATVETSTQKYHRVRVGQFEERDSALRIAEKLSQMGYSVLVTTR